RDALAAVPAPPPMATQLPPAALLKGLPPVLGARTAPVVGPAGWLILTHKDGREVRPLSTPDEVARWTRAAELQRRAYESIVLDRFSAGLGALGKAPSSMKAP
ncbi:MAG: hypothetical protein KGL53_01385, partial [Elusimicrobia bacterium]|nr:hypothetical protein [Elusimicrobiota bacterium]